MTNDWLANPEATAHIKRLLIQMGIPLETRVAQMCTDSDRWFHRVHVGSSSMFSASRLVYGDTTAETPLREVDQGVYFQSFLDMDTDATISLQIHIVIECKHREGLAVFGFPHRPKAWRRPTYPIVSEFSFAPWMQQLGNDVPFLTDDPVCTIGLLDNMHKTPRVSDEQLIYKAGASLYDFIHFQTRPMVEPYLDEAVEAMDIVNTVLDDTKESRDWRQATRYWVRTHYTEDMQHAFQTAFETKSSHFVQPITIFVPVICVDAQLYHVELGTAGAIAEMTPTPYVLSTLRVPRWPSTFQHYLVQPAVEALVTVVDVEHLGVFLDCAADWFHALGQTLMGVDDVAVMRALFEKAVLQSVASKQPALRGAAGLWNV